MPNQDRTKARKKKATSSSLADLTSRNLYRHLLGASLVSLAVFALGFMVLPALVLEASATQDVSAFASWSPVSLTLDPDYGSSDTSSSRGNVVFGSITPTSRDTSSGSYGTQRVIKKTIGITSNGTYYTVFLSTSGSDNSLALDMENTDLSIPAIGNGSTTGVWSNPVAFSASGWGFSVPSTTIPASADAVGTSASSTPPAFTNVVAGANLGKDLTKALDSSIYNQDIWSAVPSSSTPQQIWKATSTSANGFGTYTNSNNIEVTGDLVNDHFDIYYGIMVDTDVLSGTYENEIVYTALASATSLDDVSTNLSRETYIIANGTEQTLHFDLSSSLANPTNIINKDNITIYLVPHATVASANYELTSAIKNAANTYTTCTIGSNDDITITGDGNGATITCTSPDNTPADGTGLGEFDYWLHIDGYNYNYLSHYKKNEQDTASVAYIGLQSKLTDSNNELVITEMQEMTGSVCRNTNMWGNKISMDFTNNVINLDAVKLYEYNDSTEITSGIDKTNHADAIGTFELTDNRDNKTYLVRRLADGNCWMVQNLDLNLADFVGTANLTKDNTDLNGKDYWDPSASALTKARQFDETATLTNYWQIFSLNMLGIEQNKQFANLESDMYYWSSRCEAEGCENILSSYSYKILSDYPRSFEGMANWVDNESLPKPSITSDYHRTSIFGSQHNATELAGDLYNYFAATAESVQRGMSQYSVAKDSICSRGWQLPEWTRRSNNKTFLKLILDISEDANGDVMSISGSDGINAIRAFPLNIIPSGYYARNVNGTLFGFGTNTNYWSSEARNNYTAYYLRADDSTFNTDGGVEIGLGLNIRCVARD